MTPSPSPWTHYCRNRSSISRSVAVCQAFRAIDEKGVGYIETAKMSELLVSEGTPFRAKEIEAFLSVAKVCVRGDTYIVVVLSYS